VVSGCINQVEIRVGNELAAISVFLNQLVGYQRRLNGNTDILDLFGVLHQRGWNVCPIEIPVEGVDCLCFVRKAVGSAQLGGVLVVFVKITAKKVSRQED